MLGEIIQKWCRTRFYISTLYVLVKYLAVKLRAFMLQHTLSLILVQQKSNQRCEDGRMVDLSKMLLHNYMQHLTQKYFYKSGNRSTRHAPPPK